MKLVNETNVAVNYWITAPGMGDCGTIAVDGLADLPSYDNQQNVVVEFLPVGGGDFSTTWDSTKTGQQTELALVAE
jgi:hypothetical protein